MTTVLPNSAGTDEPTGAAVSAPAVPATALTATVLGRHVESTLEGDRS